MCGINIPTRELISILTEEKYIEPHHRFIWDYIYYRPVKINFVHSE